MNASSLFILLERCRKGLNRIIALSTAARFLFWTSAAAGAIAVCLRLTGLAGNIRLWWLLATLLGTSAGLIVGHKRRIDLATAAGWLDRHLRLDEALSTALICLDRECSGPFDDAIVKRACAASDRPAAVRWPMRTLGRASRDAAASLLIFGLAVSILPAFAPFHHAGPVEPAGREAGLEDRSTPAANTPAAVLSWRETAERLFPQQSELASLAEQALRTGDEELLQRLLEQSGQEMETVQPGAGGPAGSEQTATEQQQSPGGLPPRPGNDTARDGPPGQTGIANDASKEPGGEDAERQYTGERRPQGENEENTSPDDGEGQGTTGRGSEPAEGGNESSGSEPPPMGTGSHNAGGEPGSGRGDLGEVEPDSGGGRLTLNQDQGPFYQYILPGRDAAVPLAEIVPDARRTAESALEREQVPLEYEEAVGRYFEELTAKTDNAAGGN